MRYFIYISYVGQAYSGWQIQNNARSIQQTIQDTLGKILSCNISIVGSSRTDKGVHAKQQVAHVDIAKPINIPCLIYKLNRMLPADISILSMRPVLDNAHARFNALYRSYEYSLTTEKDPFHYHNTTWFYNLPSLELLNEISAFFCRKADFSYFSKINHQTKTSLCHIQKATWSQVDNKIVFYIKSDRFLHGMVRMIVSSILKVGMGKISFTTLQKWMQPNTTIRPHLTLAPPGGLTLTEVSYPDYLFCRHVT